MQLALPPVGRGVVESTVTAGQLMAHPARRSRTTFTYLAVALMGDDDDRRRYRQAVAKQHAAVRSAPGAAVPYDARRPDLQLWVAACMYVGVEDVLRLAGRLDDDLYRRCAALGTTLAVRPEQWPADRSAFGAYWEEMLGNTSIDAEVRAYLDDVAGLRFLPAPAAAVLGPLNKFFTRGFVHEPFRTQMGWSWSASDQQRFSTVLAAVFGVERRLPSRVRTFPFNLCLWDMRRRARRGKPLL